MTRRLCIYLALALVVAGALRAPTVEAALPVTDIVHIRATVAQYLKQLHEILQRDQQVANELAMLLRWAQSLEKLEELPNRDPLRVAEFLWLQGLDLVRRVEGRGVAMAYSLDEVFREFDTTYPGWRTWAWTEPLEIWVGGERIVIEDPQEWARIQNERALLAVRGAMYASQRHHVELVESNLHLWELKKVAEEVEGHQQVLELGTSFEAHSAEQLTLIRGQLLSQSNTLQVFVAWMLNREAQSQARTTSLWQGARDAATVPYGGQVPEHTGAGGYVGLPGWAR
ncbi:MAG: hypothetical protein AAGN66_26175 [Acidobacteriota bacterium]